MPTAVVENVEASKELTLDRLLVILHPMQRVTKFAFLEYKRVNGEFEFTKWRLHLLVFWISVGLVDMVANFTKISIYVKSSQLNEAQQVAAVFSIEILCVLRGTTLLLKQKDIARACNALDKYFPRNPEMQKRMCLQQNIAQVERRFRYLHNYLVLAVGGFILIPCIKFMLFAECDQPLRDDFHMHASWYPFGLKEKCSSYPYIYIFEILISLAGTFYLTTWDHAFTVLVSMLKIHFEFLNNEIVSLNAAESKDALKSSDFYRRMKHWMAYQQQLKILAQGVNDIFTFSIMICDMMSAATICFFIYLITNTDDVMAIIQFLTICLFLIWITYDVAKQGSQLEDVTSNLKESIYGINWYEGSIHFRKYVIKWLQGSEQPFRLTGFNFFEVNMEHFQKMMLLAYQMLTFLQSRRKD